MIINRIVRFVLPRQDVFFTLLEELGAKITETAAVFGELAAAEGREQFADPESIRGPTVAIHTFENEADGLYRSAVAALFENGVEARDLVRQKDMLFALEKGVDRCEDAMDVIRSVVVKNG